MATGKDNQAIAGRAGALRARGGEEHQRDLLQAGLAEETEVHRRVKAVLLYLADS